jgi:hypothetical protein
MGPTRGGPEEPAATATPSDPRRPPTTRQESDMDVPQLFADCTDRHRPRRRQRPGAAEISTVPGRSSRHGARESSCEA